MDEFIIYVEYIDIRRGPQSDYGRAIIPLSTLKGHNFTIDDFGNISFPMRIAHGTCRPSHA